MGRVTKTLLGLTAVGALGWLAHDSYQAWLKRPVWSELVVPSALAQARQFDFGAYRLDWRGQGFSISAQSNPEKTLWAVDGGFLAAGVGHAEVEEHRGALFVDERRQVLCQQQSLESFTQQGERLTLRGHLQCDDGRVSGYALILQADGQRGVSMAVAVDEPALNRLYLSWQSEADEAFYGFGEQFTEFNLKHWRLPILVQEQGIGRGLEPLTTGANLNARAGGDWWTSYAPVPHYLTSKLRSFFSESAAYQVFDLRAEDKVQLEVHASTLVARIYQGEDPAALIEAHTSVVGRMPPLPAWTQQGAILGMQGGTDKVREVLNTLKTADVPVSGLWVQDWVGQRTTTFGKQLWWSWTLDQQHYHGWPALNAELNAQGIRTLAYVNPFLVDVAEKGDDSRNLYQEALKADYLVKDHSGKPLELLNTSFSAGLVDLTNPAAHAWLKGVLNEEMLAQGFSGWMADFGEALPFESVLASGEPAELVHNRFPELWAGLNRQVVEESPRRDELFFYTRAAYSRSPGLTTAMWLGDQMVTWDRHDGLHSALIGLLSGGLSGFSINHSDIGGYTTINHPISNYHRSEELLLRWMEFAAFTALFRSHEGNRPDENVQPWSNEVTQQQFARMGKVFAALADYRSTLMAEASTRGLPLVRPLWLHYPQDPASQAPVPESFMLGSELLIAPVLAPDVTELEVALPEGTWVHLWSGQTHQVNAADKVRTPVPVGEPAVFYRAGSAAGQALRETLQAQGLITASQE
ncbi:alpha-glucosidase [Atopomonas hussainii]|uniref:Alpha-glucosidase n=1 Tax=Atopomonas hussainii TaxID=1429083 RepID=A0A1H7PWA3_9GAMM|nr:alpha-glucosidase [Atopomonas hussainii]SEL39545.1 alpha-glucosidase [Atopomonas hussainii]